MMRRSLARAYQWIDPPGDPPPLFLPENTEDASRWLQERHEGREGVLVLGGGCHSYLGDPPGPIQAVLGTSRWDAILEHSPPDMTLTAEAGCPVGKLRQKLLETRQYLPFLEFCRSEATVGGVVACAWEGPAAGQMGSARDCLIGVEVLHPEGFLSHAGGKVVKNVAGYDLCKLYCGSFGTLGVLTRLTFKVRPRPEGAPTALIPVQAGALALEEGCRIRDRLSPTALEVASEDATRGRWILAARFEDIGEVLDWKCREAGSVEAILEGRQESDFWSGRIDRAEASGLSSQGGCLLQVRGPLGALAEAVEALARLFQPPPQWSFSLLRGRLMIRVAEDQAVEGVRRMRERFVGRLRCHLWKAPPRLRGSVPSWDLTAEVLRLQRGLQRQFDPHGILNPGRI